MSFLQSLLQDVTDGVQMFSEAIEAAVDDLIGTPLDEEQQPCEDDDAGSGLLPQHQETKLVQQQSTEEVATCGVTSINKKEEEICTESAQAIDAFFGSDHMHHRSPPSCVQPKTTITTSPMMSTLDSQDVQAEQQQGREETSCGADTTPTASVQDASPGENSGEALEVEGYVTTTQPLPSPLVYEKSRRPPDSPQDTPPAVVCCSARPMHPPPSLFDDSVPHAVLPCVASCDSDASWDVVTLEPNNVDPPRDLCDKKADHFTSTSFLVVSQSDAVAGSSQRDGVSGA
mmetsp:Transcript_68371/g.79615  ORF Transcript_68371/g.79615 Transcript_68371/m.79615 type:complete len:287 (+) Transcript_68371:94-954(+)